MRKPIACPPFEMTMRMYGGHGARSARLCPPYAANLVIASAAKRSIPPRKERMDCFVPFAPRNDERGDDLQIHHHVIALHRDLEGLRDIRPLHHGRSRLDIHRIRLGAKPAGIAVGLAGADVELPAVPGAADDLAQPGVFDLAGIAGLREPDQW